MKLQKNKVPEDEPVKEETSEEAVLQRLAEVKKRLQEQGEGIRTESSSSRGPPENIQEQVEHPDMSLPGRKSGPRAQTKGKKQHKRAGGR